MALPKTLLFIFNLLSQRNTMKLFCTLPLIAAMSMAFSGAARSQSLVELYDVAKDYDASYKSVQLQAQATRLKVQQAQAKLGPTATASANVSLNSGGYYAPTSTVHSYGTQTGTLLGSQPLFRPADKAEVSQANLQLQIADAQLLAAEQDLMVRLSQTYFDILASLDSLTFIQAQMKAVAEQLAFAKRNFEVGTATITDTREAQASYDLAVAQEIAAQNDLRVKKMALDQLVGKSDTSPKPISLTVEPQGPVPDRVEEWVALTEQKNPSIKQYRITSDVARLETDKAQSALLPTVDLQLSYSYTNNSSGTYATTYDSRVGVTTGAVVVSVPLFNGNALSNRVKETISLRQKAESDVDTAVRNTSQNTRSAFFGLLSGISQIKALKAAEESSQVALDANKLGYSVGVRININVLDAQSKLYDTKAKLAKARYDVLVGHLKLRQLSGVLQVEDLQNINSMLTP
jgi:outer membrane protein